MHGGLGGSSVRSSDRGYYSRPPPPRNSKKMSGGVDPSEVSVVGSASVEGSEAEPGGGACCLRGARKSPHGGAQVRDPTQDDLYWSDITLFSLQYSQASGGSQSVGGRRGDSGAGAAVLMVGLVIFSLAYYFSKPSLYDVTVVRWGKEQIVFQCICI